MAMDLENKFKAAFAAFEKNKSAPRKKIPSRKDDEGQSPSHERDDSSSKADCKQKNAALRKIVPAPPRVKDKQGQPSVQENQEDYMGMAFEDKLDAPQEEYAAIDVDQKQAFEQQQEDYQNVVFESVDSRQQSQGGNNKMLINEVDPNQQEIYANTPFMPISPDSQPEEELYANLGPNAQGIVNKADPSPTDCLPDGTKEEAGNLKPTQKLKRQVPAPPAASSKSQHKDQSILSPAKGPTDNVKSGPEYPEESSKPLKKAGVPPPPKEKSTYKHMVEENLYAEPRETFAISHNDSPKTPDDGIQKKNKKSVALPNIYGPEPSPEDSTEVPKLHKSSIRKSLLYGPLKKLQEHHPRTKDQCCRNCVIVIVALLIPSLVANGVLVYMNYFKAVASRRDSASTTKAIEEVLAGAESLYSTANIGLLLNVGSLYHGTNCTASSERSDSPCVYAIDGRDTVDNPNPEWQTETGVTKGAGIQLKLKSRAYVVAVEFIQSCARYPSLIHKIKMEFGDNLAQILTLERDVGRNDCHDVLNNRFLITATKSKRVGTINITVLETHGQEHNNTGLVEVRIYGFYDYGQPSREHCCPKPGNNFEYSPELRRCYRFSGVDHNLTKSRTEAQSHCQGIGGELLSINSVQEDFMLRPHIQKLYDEKVRLLEPPSMRSWWIGLKGETPTGPWKWSPTLLANYTNWKKDEPSNNEDEKCVELLPSTERVPDYSWNNAKCLKRLLYICEIESLC